MRIGFQLAIGINDLVEREASGDFADDRRSVCGERESLRDQGRKLGDTFDPMHAVVLRNENRSGKEFVEVDVRRRTGQFPVTDQAASRREQLQAGVAGGGADRIKNRGDASAPGTFVYRFTHILNSSIDGVDGPCGANGVHPVCRWRYRSL